MKYCNSCKVYYDNDLNNCVVCKTQLTLLDDNFNNNYPTYKRKYNVKSFIYKLILFLNILSILSTIFIDYLINAKLTFSLVVSLSNIYFILFLKIILNFKSLLNNLLNLSIINIVYLIALGLLLNNYYWAIDFVLPFLLMLNSLTIFTISLFNYKKRDKYINLIFIGLIFNILIIFVNIFNLSNIKWAINTSFIFGLSLFIFLLIFMPKDMKEELKRRFHI